MQMQMESQQANHTNRLAEASTERERLAAHLATALDSCRQLEGDLQQSRCASETEARSYHSISY